MNSSNVLEIPADSSPEYIEMVADVLKDIGLCAVPYAENGGNIQLCKRTAPAEGDAREHIHGWEIIARRMERRGYGRRPTMDRGIGL